MTHVIWHDLLVPGVPLLEKVLRTLAVYVFLLVGLRLAGKRELGQLNPFDLVVLLLLSNTVQNAIIGNDDSLVGGLVGAAVLIGFNELVLRWFYRSDRLTALEGTPDVLVSRGRILTRNLQKAMITRAELETAARKQGIESLRQVKSARLEPSGALTFVEWQPPVEERRQHELLDRLDELAGRQREIVDRLDALEGRAEGAAPAAPDGARAPNA